MKLHIGALLTPMKKILVYFILLSHLSCTKTDLCNQSCYIYEIPDSVINCISPDYDLTNSFEERKLYGVNECNAGNSIDSLNQSNERRVSNYASTSDPNRDVQVNALLTYRSYIICIDEEDNQ